MLLLLSLDANSAPFLGVPPMAHGLGSLPLQSAAGLSASTLATCRV